MASPRKWTGADSLLTLASRTLKRAARAYAAASVTFETDASDEAEIAYARADADLEIAALAFAAAKNRARKVTR